MKVLTTNTRIEPRIIYKENKSEGVLNYDADNSYPQRMRIFIESSGQATRCVKLLKKFYVGGGFADKNLYKLKVNREGLTGDKLLRKTCDDKAHFNGCAIQVNYNANYKVDSLHHVSFEHCRLGIPDDLEYVGKVAVYDNWAREKSRRIENKWIQWVNVWNPDPQVIQAQVNAAGGWDKYKGQMYWYSCDGPNQYPKSPLDPVINDVDSDAQASIFKNRNIRNNFVAYHIGKYKGKFETPKEREEFQDSLRGFQGAENAATIMLIELGGVDESFTMEDLKTANLDKLYQYTEESVRDNIRRVILAPQVLVGDFIQGKLGTATEIQDAVNYFNAATYDDRLEIEEIFTEIFSYWKDPLANNYTIIPLQKFWIGEPATDTTPAEEEPLEIAV